jgi:hypothetical protein
MEIGNAGVLGRGEGLEEYTSRDLNHQTSGCSPNSGQQQQQPGPSAALLTRQQGRCCTLAEILNKELFAFFANKNFPLCTAL